MAKRVNWEFIRPLYRADKMSNRELARYYAELHQDSKEWKETVSEKAIRKQAKSNPDTWAKNLANKVKEQVQENLVRRQVRNADHASRPASDQEIVNQVAEIGSGVILRHREEIAALLQYENDLLIELGSKPKKSYMANYQGEIISKDVELTVKEKTAALKDLAFVRAKRIELERQAYDLNSGDLNNDNPHEEGLEYLA